MVARPNAPAAEPEAEMPLRRFYQVVFRHKKKMAAFFVLVVGAVMAMAVMTPPSYRSEAKILVQVGRESVTLDPTVAIGERTLDPRTTWENEINSELEIARSNELVREVVIALGPEVVLGRGGSKGPPREKGRLERTLEGWMDTARARVRALLPAGEAPLAAEDQAVLLVSSKLDIRLVLDSSVIKIGYQASQRELAQRVVATLIERYMEKHLDVHATRGSFEFFSEETRRLYAELTAREDELRRLETSVGISSLEEERRILLERVSALEQDLDLTLAAVDSSAARVATLEQALATDEFQERIVTQETVGSVTTTRDLLRQQLNGLLLEEQSLLQSYEPDTPPVRSVRERIALANELLKAEVPTVAQTTHGMNPSRQNILVALTTEQSNLSSLAAKRDVQRPQLAALRARLTRIDDLDLEIQRKRREIATLTEQHRRHSASLEQVRIDQALQLEKISNVSVLQPATLPLRSNTMGKTVALILGVVLGLVGALALAFVADFLDQSLRSPEDVRRRLGLATLAAVPRTRSLRRRRRIALRQLRAFSQLEDRIASPSEAETRVLAVTSAHRGEGVSTVSANLANALAARGEGPVLLVDAALYAPSVHRTFSAAISPGLGEKLFAAASNGTRESAVPNLRILTVGDLSKAGPRKGRFGRESSTFDRLARDLDGLLEDWRRDYRYVVLDLPALNEDSQVPHVAARCDGTLLVVAAGKSRWQILQHAREELDSGRAALLGIVLNKRRFPIPGWLYRTL